MLQEVGGGEVPGDRRRQIFFWNQGHTFEKPFIFLAGLVLFSSEIQISIAYSESQNQRSIFPRFMLTFMTISTQNLNFSSKFSKNNKMLDLK